MLTHEGDPQEIYRSVGKLELGRKTHHRLWLIPLPPGSFMSSVQVVKAYLKAEQITLESSGMWEKGEK